MTSQRHLTSTTVAYVTKYCVQVGVLPATLTTACGHSCSHTVLLVYSQNWLKRCEVNFVIADLYCCCRSTSHYCAIFAFNKSVVNETHLLDIDAMTCDVRGRVVWVVEFGTGG